MMAYLFSLLHSNVHLREVIRPFIQEVVELGKNTAEVQLIHGEYWKKNVGIIVRKQTDFV